MMVGPGIGNGIRGCAKTGNITHDRGIGVQTRPDGIGIVGDPSWEAGGLSAAPPSYSGKP